MAYKLKQNTITARENRDYIRLVHKTAPKRKVRQTKKKKTSFLSLILIFIFLSAFGYYICPYTFVHFTKPLFINRILNRNLYFDAKKYVSPTLNYISNTCLFDTNLLVSPTEKSNIVIPMTISGKLFDLEEKLNNLASSYPGLDPSVFVWDFKTGKSAELNPDVRRPMASLVKIPILFELFRQIDFDKEVRNLEKQIVMDPIYKASGSGKLQYNMYGQELSLDYLANVMIVNSDNTATNIILEEIGGIHSINASFRQWGLNGKVQNLLPDLEGTNKISARDLGILLYNLDNTKFLTQKSREQIKKYMSSLPTQHLIKAGLPEEALLLHKTGDIGKMLGDAGIVYTENGNKYIVVFMVSRKHNDSMARNFIEQASSIIYTTIKDL